MSSISKAPFSSKNMTSHDESSEEESGWTKYFEDFFNNNHDVVIDHDQKCSIIDDSSSSFVPDAAAKKLADSSKRSSFKKRKKIKTTLVDDDLEDTASSPINSPKVVYEDQFSKAKEKEEEIHLYQEKGNTTGEREERKELGFNERDSDCTELKKKGLCLVPLSMVVNYLG